MRRRQVTLSNGSPDQSHRAPRRHHDLQQSPPGGPRHVATSLWFFALGDIASTIALNAGKGDQLILEAKVIANQWTDQSGEKQLGHTFIVTGFKFDARRGGRGSPSAARPDVPDNPLTSAATALEVTDRQMIRRGPLPRRRGALPTFGTFVTDVAFRCTGAQNPSAVRHFRNHTVHLWANSTQTRPVSSQPV